MNCFREVTDRWPMPARGDDMGYRKSGKFHALDMLEAFKMFPEVEHGDPLSKMFHKDVYVGILYRNERGLYHDDSPMNKKEMKRC